MKEEEEAGYYDLVFFKGIKVGFLLGVISGLGLAWMLF